MSNIFVHIASFPDVIQGNKPQKRYICEKICDLLRIQLNTNSEVHITSAARHPLTCSQVKRFIDLSIYRIIQLLCLHICTFIASLKKRHLKPQWDGILLITFLYVSCEFVWTCALYFCLSSLSSLLAYMQTVKPKALSSRVMLLSSFTWTGRNGMISDRFIYSIVYSTNDRLMKREITHMWRIDLLRKSAPHVHDSDNLFAMSTWTNYMFYIIT